MTEHYKTRINNFSKNIANNMAQLEPYYNYKFYLFCQQKILVDEILDCLLIGLNQASIVLTNHLLERMLKFSLINSEMRGLHVGDSDFNSKYNEAEAKYDGEDLSKNINTAFAKEIINEEEKKELLSLKDKFRNPYSHANITKILKDIPQNTIGLMYSFSEVKDALQKSEDIPQGQEIEIPTNIMAQYNQKDIADDSAFEYFRKIFGVMCKIEERNIE